MTRITKVPKCPLCMKGVTNLRSSVLPVIDTRIKFGIAQTEQTVYTCIIVLDILMEGETITIGAQIDSVQEVLDFKREQIQPAPRIGSKYKSEFIAGMVKKEEALIMLLHIDSVFSTQELLTLKEAHA